MAYCPSCGTEATGNARFCSQCGAAFGAKAEAMPVSKVASGDGQAAAGVGPAEPMWTGWPCWRWYLPWIILTVVVVIGASIAATVTQAALLWVIAGLAGVGCLWFLGCMVWESFKWRYSVTTDRLFIREGIFWRTTDQTELVRVDDLRVQQGPVERMMGIGDVFVIASTDRLDASRAPVDERSGRQLQGVNLRHICEPEKVAEIIRENMRRLRQRRGMYIENV